jgi:hypothetical protein
MTKAEILSAVQESGRQAAAEALAKEFDTHAMALAEKGAVIDVLEAKLAAAEGTIAHLDAQVAAIVAGSTPNNPPMPAAEPAPVEPAAEPTPAAEPVAG